jgi:tRNA A58 N-methylase Trm61
MARHSHAAVLLFVTLLVPVPASAQRAAESTIANERIFEAISLRPGITVCELGAGDGALSVAAARLVGPAGRVFTSELGDERVKTLRENVAKSGLTNITVVEGAPGGTNLTDGSCDALFLRNVYHHFPEPAAMNAAIRSAVKPGARVAVVDFTPPGNEAPTPAERSKDGMHGVKPETLTRELREAGFQEVALERGTERWFMVVVSRPDS